MLLLTFVLILSSYNVASLEDGSVFTLPDLQNIEESCYSRGFCQRGRRNRLDISTDWKEVNCFCDDNCINYGDCCLEANAYDGTKMAQNIDKFDCVNVFPLGQYYMQGKCAENWTDKSLNELCLVASEPSTSGGFNKDPFLHTPVTSTSTDITYKNYYCAVCNNESQTDLHPWHAQVTCPEAVDASEEYLKKNVQFVNDTWGVYVNHGDRTEFYSCDIFPVVTDSVSRKIRKCLDYITTCSPNWEDKYVEKLCRAYTTVVYGPPPHMDDTDEISLTNNDFSNSFYYFNQAYRNYHCAVCNYVSTNGLSCYERDFRTAHPISPVSLSVLFDFGRTESPCPLGQIWDPFSKNCRLVFCVAKNEEFRYGSCMKISAGDDMEEYNEIDGNSTKDSADFLNGTSCDKIFFNDTEYTEGNNGSIIIRSIRRTYKKNEYEVYKEGILVCIPNSYSRLMGWLTLLGLGTSCVCIVVHLSAFIIVPDLRNLSGKNLASLCVALLGAYISFLVTTFRESGTSGCPLLASIMYYFFLASFAWMNVMAFDIWRTLQLATKVLRVTAGKQWAKFFGYSIYAWSLPLAALAVVLAIDWLKPEFIPFDYLPELGKKFCWFGQRNAILVYFAAPLGAVMILNILFFILAVKIVAQTTQSTKAISATQSHQVQLKLYLRLALLMGLSWISGIIAGLFQKEYMWYVFILLNAFQGLYILIAFTCTKKVRKVLTDPNSRLFKLSNRNAFKTSSSTSGRPCLEGRDSNISQLSNTTSTTNLSNSNCKSGLHPSP